MRNLSSTKRKIALMLAALVLLCTVQATVAMAEDLEFFDTSPFKGKVIGVQTGTTSVEYTPEFIEDPQLAYFNSTVDLVNAIIAKKIDAAVADEPNMRYLGSKVEGVRVETLDSPLDLLAIITSRTGLGAEVLPLIDEYLSALNESGDLERLQDKWFTEENPTFDQDYSNLPDINGTLIVATDPTFAPFEYISEGEIVGYEIELVYAFCKEYGYAVSLQNSVFGDIIAGITAGKYHIGAAGFTITEERKNSVDFTDPIYESRYAIVFLDESASDSAGFFGNISGSFHRTFIEESRWKSFLSGAEVTMRITVVSMLSGTVLGFLWYMLYRTGWKIIRKASDALCWIFDGMPVVVLLMVLYYIVFGNSSASGETVSIVGFTMLIACFMLQALFNAENALDKGQCLAAKSLGYKDSKAFFRVVLPQISRFIWPQYKGKISDLIKSTAVVGYIAVVDITKQGDLIRGATYDAFTPIISVAIAYFIMTALLQLIARLVEKRTDPFSRSEKQILKGMGLK